MSPSPSPGLGLGLGTTLQVEPSQCSISVCWAGNPALPTAHSSGAPGDEATGAYGGFGWVNPYEAGDPSLSDPVVANGLLYETVGDGDPEGIYAIDLATRNAVRVTPPFTPQTQPIVVNGGMYSAGQAFTLAGGSLAGG